MDVSGLSDYQLFELSSNRKLDPDIRAAAAGELERRNLTDEQRGLLLLKREQLLGESQPESNKLLRVMNWFLGRS
ncbi:hypothetical protein [Dinghuibacter silviterrae]|uniref:Uncharacterized protein n=1 Tax=Dinghuibacter silviterrae TaxID=1539049 RepID=A0A4R8DWN4_9BACT|nr:hypothetical protein [Dinghuibacter silviterrae]TDX02348.1 hypothetical protein EDB95_3406 [Dinghuibacter silviterrae]